LVHFSGTRYQHVRKALTFIYEGEVKCSSERECDDFEDVAYALQLKISKTKEHHQQKPDPEPIITELPLPIEIQMKIFSYLPTPDLLKNVSLVSKPFRDLVKEPKVHINVSLKLTHFSFELIRFLERAIFMKELRIDASILMGSITAKRTFQKDTREATYYFGHNCELPLHLKDHKHLEVLLLDNEDMLRVSSCKNNSLMLAILIEL
jgi:hypothetical protein